MLKHHVSIVHNPCKWMMCLSSTKWRHGLLLSTAIREENLPALADSISIIFRSSSLGCSLHFNDVWGRNDIISTVIGRECYIILNDTYMYMPVYQWAIADETYGYVKLHIWNSNLNSDSVVGSGSRWKFISRWYIFFSNSHFLNCHTFDVDYRWLMFWWLSKLTHLVKIKLRGMVTTHVCQYC